jgi:hypothetical protein
MPDDNPSSRKLRLGVISVGDMSFWPYRWADLLHPHGQAFGGGTLGTDLLRMEITHVWDIDHDVARQFAEKIGATAVSTYDGMIGAVDGVAFGGYFDVPWQHRLARPYLEAGIPVCLSRPFAYSLADIDEILDLAARHNTPLLATDLYEHIHGVDALRSGIEQIGEIRSVLGTCLTVDFPALFHTQYMILQIFGFDVGQVSIITDDPLASTYLAGSYLFNGSADREPFLCTMTQTSGDLYRFIVTGTKGTVTESLPQMRNIRDDLRIHHLPMLLAIQRTLEGHVFEPPDNIRKKTEIFLTGFYSAAERGGAPVPVGTVPMNWHAPPARPGFIDENIF